MVVKDVFIENNKKKVFDDVLGKKIAERIKYTCVFYDDNKNQFKEVLLYETMLRSFEEIHIARKDKNKIDKNHEYISLIEEAKKYKIPEYQYGKIVYFKTKKFEIFKKRKSVKEVGKNRKKGNEENTNFKEVITIQNVVNYSTPEFVLSGIKKEIRDNSFYPNGDLRKSESEIMYKIKWFNSNQMKFSEIYLPAECFTDIQPFETKVAHN